MDTTLIKNRITSLDPDYVAFASSFAPNAAVTFGDAAGLVDDQLVIFENGILLYLLALLNEEELIEFVNQECTLEASRARQVVYGLIASLPTDFEVFHASIFASLNSNDDDTEALATDIAAMQEEMKAMAANYSTEQVHSTSQDSILKNQ